VSDTLVCLRACGERTEELAERLLREQFAEVQTLRIRPFAEAVRECFRRAEGYQWLVTCDADVLIAPNCRAKVENIKGRMEGYWQAIGYVVDKLAGTTRLGGIRIYRASELPQMLPRIKDSIRPEGDLCAINTAWLRAPEVMGRHDFEQFYADLYRKGKQHAVKHPKWASSIVSKWRRSRDPDIKAALAGWEGRDMTWHEKAPL
jgi:hypothetical protein